MLSTRHLGTPKPPWALLTLCDAETLRQVAKREFPRLFVATVSGKDCKTKRGLLRAFAEALRFPKYFGNNWDAFEECINDLRWLKADGYLVVVPDAEMLLATRDEDYKTFMSIITEAGKQWAERPAQPRAFHLVLAPRSPEFSRHRRWDMSPTSFVLSTP